MTLRPPPDPPCADRAPVADGLTSYDYDHLITYLRILDADAEGADWKDVPHRECISTRRLRSSEPAGPGKAIWPAPHG
jgi:hypothetical protein